MVTFKKYVVYVGNYGSGKTELALNTALFQKSQGKKGILVDMDIVNPYFRSSEREKMLIGQQIRVVKPYFANTMVDVPSLPAEIYSAFDSAVDFAVFDAGGDPVGAAALGLLKEKFAKNREDTEVLFVTNSFRPMQKTPEDIIGLLREIEGKSGLLITGLVNNANLASQTQMDTVKQGLARVKEVSMQTGIPIKYTSLKEGLAKGDIEGDVFPIQTYMRPDWLDAT